MELDNFDIAGDRYLQGQSAIGIIYNKDVNELNPDFYNFYPFLNAEAGLILPQSEGAGPARFTACSSTGGMLAVLDTANNQYFVGNPFSPSTDNYIALPPTPRPHFLHNTHVVLTTGAHIDGTGIFHLICAVRQDPGYYDFEVWNSRARRFWITRKNIPLNDREIEPNSGVSGRSCVYWLASGPPSRSVLRVDAFSIQLTFWPLQLREDVVLDHPRTMIQLGIAARCPFLAVVNGAAVNIPRVDLHRVKDDGSMPPIAFLDLAISQEVNWDDVTATRVLEDNVLPCTELPRPVKFESHKVEVPLWVDGRVVLLEQNNDDNGDEIQCRALMLAEKAEIRVADGFGHVRTATLPRDFPPRYVQAGVVQKDHNVDDDSHQDDSDEDDPLHLPYHFSPLSITGR